MVIKQGLLAVIEECIYEFNPEIIKRLKELAYKFYEGRLALITSRKGDLD